MKTEELIHGFIDGSLSIEEEKILFEKLLYDPQLKLELRNSLIIESEMKSNAANISPSPASANAIFSTLGFKVPESTTFSAKKNPSLISKTYSNIKSFYSVYSQGINSSIVSSIVTAIMIIYFIYPYFDMQYFNNENVGNKSNIALNRQQKQLPVIVIDKNKIAENASKSSDKSEEVTSLNNDISESQSLDNDKIFVTGTDDKYINTKSSQKDQYHSIIQNEQKKYPLAALMNQNTIKDLKPTYHNNSIDFQNREISELVSFPELAEKPTSQSILNTNYITDSKFGFSLEIIGTMQNSFQDEFIQPKNKPVFSNSSVNLSFEYNEYLEFGAGICQELFYQEYDGTKDNGKAYKYYQYPSFLTYNIFGRYTFYTYQNIDLFSQLTLGYNTAGPVTRISSGLGYSPSSDYKIFLGFETSALYFQHKRKSFYSPKYAFVYAIQFNF